MQYLCVDLICTFLLNEAMVRSQIQEETDRVTGKTKQISSLPINLSIYSPNGAPFMLLSFIYNSVLAFIVDLAVYLQEGMQLMVCFLASICICPLCCILLFQSFVCYYLLYI